MAVSDGMFLAAGGLALTGNFVKAGGFPSNGYGIIGGTIALAFIASMTKSTPLDKPMKAFAGLVLLVAIYTYVPTLRKSGKGKKNG